MNYFRCILLLAIAGITACSKKEYLETDPNSSAINTLADCQSLLNNKAVFNETPVLGEISSDSYYIDADKWQYLGKAERNAYLWADDIFEGQGNVPDYSIPYAQVHIANQVLKALSRIKINEVEQTERDIIKGTAFFLRAYAFYNLLQLFAVPYDNATASVDYGIALPLTPDINTVYTRATVKDSYQQVITDLQKARKLLIDSVYGDVPSKPAADALLARVYLSMRDYIRAGAFADSCLQKYNKLMNYNVMSLLPAFPIPSLNEEVLYNSNLLSSNGIILARVVNYSIIDSTLYASYAVNDLRKAFFYRSYPNKQPTYKASYTGNIYAFSGLATDEVYLIRAECRARAGEIKGAMQDVNTLLTNRYKTGTFQHYSAASIEEAVLQIIDERKKELVFRGLRFTDLRRLNKEGAGIMLHRIDHGSIYQLLPNSLRYTLPIPDDAIAGSRIVQNPR